MRRILKHPYQTSTDYKRLFELAKRFRIVCFVDYGDRENPIRDVVQTQATEPTNMISVGSRGIGYIDAFDHALESIEEDFITQCEECNLEFIDIEDEK